MSGKIVIKILVALLPVTLALAQKSVKVPVPVTLQNVEPPDSGRVKQEFLNLLQRYPPTLSRVFREDPTLLTLPPYLAPYPALDTYLNQHPEIPLNPSFYLNGLGNQDNDWRRNPRDRTYEMWNRFFQNLSVFAGFALAIGLLTWLIRTFVDYRRWNRLSKVQAEVHTRLLDRFNTNEELMAYIATPAGSKFLQSAPILLDTGSASRSMGAPLSRIMLALQAGVVLAAAGIGLIVASRSVMDREASDPLHLLGLIAIALGIGFAVAAGASFFISERLGLLEPASRKRGPESSEQSQ